MYKVIKQNTICRDEKIVNATKAHKGIIIIERYTLMLCLETLYIIKMSIFPKLILVFITVTINIQIYKGFEVRTK